MTTHKAIREALPELPAPDRTMWQHGKQINHYTADQMRAYALQAVEAKSAEPQAIVRSVSPGENGVQVRWLGGFPQIGQKLYAESKALRREPMTEKEMEEGRERIFSVNNPYCPCDRKTFSKVARYVEAHHHITQKEQSK